MNDTLPVYEESAIPSSFMPTDQELAQTFKAYDIRGLSPTEIDATYARRLGTAVALKFKPKRVMVGWDIRTTSAELEGALVESLVSSGIDVVRIGLCSTPMFNILLGLADGSFDLGVMVTASHNPGKYNGFKVTLGDCSPVGQGSGMEELRDIFLGIDESWAKEGAPINCRGTVTEDPSALDRYLDYVISLAHLPADMPKMKVAIDAGNGMAGAVVPRLLEKLPWIEATELYFTPDGTFPNHEANPLKHETLNELIKTVKEQGCALGVAFDGDADRVGFVDEHGEQIPGDLLTGLLSQSVLLEHPDALVLYDVRSSWSVPEAIEEAGGHSEMCKVGHANIKRLMREKLATFAGELSMHFYFKQLWNCESGDFAMLLLLRRLAEEGKSLSSLWKPLLRYAKSEEINFTVKDAPAVMKQLEDAYAPSASTVSHTDGVRLEFVSPEGEREWWFNVRASNTEPLLRLNLEARTPEMLQEKLKELSARIA